MINTSIYGLCYNMLIMRPPCFGGWQKKQKRAHKARPPPLAFKVLEWPMSFNRPFSMFSQHQYMYTWNKFLSGVATNMPLCLICLYLCFNSCMCSLSVWNRILLCDMFCAIELLHMGYKHYLEDAQRSIFQKWMF